ncbi:hypothetical protein TNCV_112821 [Trichonephila clavipes]|nr:hypothetical protein TNCV_112821 [Trichonephila clavipes]
MRPHLNSRRAASPLVWLMEGEDKWEALAPQGFLPLNWGGTEQNRTVTCMVLKAKSQAQGLENISLPFGFHAEIVEVEIEVVSPSIVPSGNFSELNRTVTCMVLKANDRRTSSPCHDVFRGPRSDYVRQVALETSTTNKHF